MEKNCLKIMENFENISLFYELYESKKRNYGTAEEFTSTELRMLGIVIENKNITPTEIAKKIFKTKGSVSQMIKKLIEKELIGKSKNSKDKRIAEYKITEKGFLIHNFHQNYELQLAHLLMKKMNVFTPSDIEIIERFLNIYEKFQFEVFNFSTKNMIENK